MLKAQQYTGDMFTRAHFQKAFLGQPAVTLQNKGVKVCDFGCVWVTECVKVYVYVGVFVCLCVCVCGCVCV